VPKKTASAKEPNFIIASLGTGPFLDTELPFFISETTPA